MATPKFDALPQKERAIIRDATEYDRYLYGALRLRWRLLVDQQDSSFWEEVAEFKRIQAELISTCKSNPTHPVCMWYSLSDSDYLKLVPESGYCEPVPFS